MLKITGALSHNAHMTNIKTVRQYIYNLVADHFSYHFQENECYSSLVWDS